MDSFVFLNVQTAASTETAQPLKSALAKKVFPFQPTENVSLSVPKAAPTETVSGQKSVTAIKVSNSVIMAPANQPVPSN